MLSIVSDITLEEFQIGIITLILHIRLPNSRFQQIYKIAHILFFQIMKLSNCTLQKITQFRSLFIIIDIISPYRFLRQPNHTDHDHRMK